MTFIEYVPFCIADEKFHDVPDRLRDDGSKFDAAQRPVPPGWVRRENGLSLALLPNEFSLPDQGWKIHVSTTPSDASQVIDLIWEYCVANRIGFKFLRSHAALLATNSKYWSRSASGKVITLYPRDDTQSHPSFNSRPNPSKVCRTIHSQ